MTSFSLALQERFFSMVERVIRERFAQGDTDEEPAKLFVFDVDDRKDFLGLDADDMPPDLIRALIGDYLRLERCAGVGHLTEGWIAAGNRPLGWSRRTDAIFTTFYSRDRAPSVMVIDIEHARGQRWLGETRRCSESAQQLSVQYD
jgi:hypothetical protein